MSEEIQGDLGRNPAGRRLADVALEKVIAEPAFVTLLLMLCGRKSSSAKEVNKEGPAVEQEPTGAGKRKSMKENQKLKERLKEAEAKKKKKQEVYQYEEDRSAAPKKMPIKMPKELWGLTPMKQGAHLLRLLHDDLQGKGRQMRQRAPYLHALLEVRPRGSQLPRAVTSARSSKRCVGIGRS